MGLFYSDMIRLLAALIALPKDLVDPFEIRGVGLDVEKGTFESSFPDSSSGQSQTVIKKTKTILVSTVKSIK